MNQLPFICKLAKCHVQLLLFLYETFIHLSHCSFANNSLSSYSEAGKFYSKLLTDLSAALLGTEAVRHRMQFARRWHQEEFSSL